MTAAGGPVDDSSFADLVARHRRELLVHCYRMLGSFDDAEDMVQETFARAWRGRAGYTGSGPVRAWLYRIATNVCLTFLDRHPRRPVPAGDLEPGEAPPATVPWLQPFPDRLLPEPASGAAPDAAVVARETIELAFLLAVQHLPPRQRAVLIMRDVLGWPADQTASALEVSVATVKSALQRARATLRHHLPRRRDEWPTAAAATEVERAVVRRYVAAHQQADPAALTALLRDDARMTMPPEPVWYVGRDAIVKLWSSVMVGPGAWGQWLLVPTAANRQPAVASYLRRPGEASYRAANLDVLRIADGVITHIVGFDATAFPAMGLPAER